MSALIDYLPIWKKDSTAEEWLLELAAIARKHPECFTRIVVVSLEERKAGLGCLKLYNKNASVIETLGMLELGKTNFIGESRV